MLVLNQDFIRVATVKLDPTRSNHALTAEDIENRKKIAENGSQIALVDNAYGYAWGRSPEYIGAPFDADTEVLEIELVEWSEFFNAP